MGKGKARVLGVRSFDPVMSVLGSIGLAASAGTALLVDLNDQVGRGGGRTLADLSGDGPRLEELSPGRPGVAVLRGGHIEVDECERVLDRLARHWPAIVVRTTPQPWPGAVVPVHALYPGWLAPVVEEPAVWQSFSSGSRPSGPGPVLPRIRSHEVRRIIAGGLPPKGRWLSTWERVWELPWA